MTKTYQINLVLAKLTQNKFWINPLRKYKSRVTKMDEKEYIRCMEIVNSIKK